ncbi:universal stress protein [Pseudenhygromyxa sp. WMMC2535]|uniref:universal stress protein n=1 Tax=Pseudenhygromyxa sp. WMMC2535 TaxID=2712867 RepID=UPI001552D380|nr:universal stress protein [Pseudenhygromyxa sp. WMMC2535]NVB42853.1 universal stress protein [Pseudenhygromyxa sp. WMMC2535]
MSGPFEFTLGLDLRPQTTGAIEYAMWLCKTANMKAAGHVRPLHVIEPDAMVELMRHADEATIIGAFKQRGKEILDSIAHDGHMHAPEVLGGDAVELLETRAVDQGSTALIVGRRAPGDATGSFPRLGIVARKLLRRLRLPIIVAPSDLLASNVGEGPVVVAVDFQESSARAVKWAQGVADSLGRELLLLHLAEMPDQLGYAGFIQSERWEQLAREILDRGNERMAQFMRAHDISGVRTSVVRGPVLPGLIEAASAAKACMLVSGSGHHGMLHRVIVPSVASESAAISSVPVAVVP